MENYKNLIKELEQIYLATGDIRALENYISNIPNPLQIVNEIKDYISNEIKNDGQASIDPKHHISRCYISQPSLNNDELFSNILCYKDPFDTNEEENLYNDYFIISFEYGSYETEIMQHLILKLEYDCMLQEFDVEIIKNESNGYFIDILMSIINFKYLPIKE